jgi:serine/threonine protein kinase
MASDFGQNMIQRLSEHIVRDYRILRLLGKGGMGEVYLAEQLRVGRRLVALKVLSDSCAARPEMAQRFENEASSAGRINHRNVVTVYESRVTEDGQMYVAMEFVEGKSLTEVLKEAGALSLDKVIEITKQICAGLAAAHKLGIVHRDIKPDNIMLAEEDGKEVVKLLDFGIARLSETDSSLGKTRAGVIMGTPTYMSPEQAMGKTADNIDARSDIYSVGMVIHQMLTGHVAFKAPTPMEIMRKHISEVPLPLKHWRDDLQIPDAVERVVLKALEKNRDKRQQSIGELAQELEAAAAGKNPDASVSQKDMPTIRITKEAPIMATAPLSSEKTGIGKSAPLMQQLQQTSVAANPSQPNLQQATAVANPAPTDFQAARKTAPPVRPETVSDTNKSIQSARPRSYKKELLIAAVVVLAILAIVAVVIKLTGESDITVVSTNRLLEYRVKRENATAEAPTLSLDNTLRIGEGFGFEVKTIYQGSLYLFDEQSEQNSGSWQWLNAAAYANAQTTRVGEWLPFPFGYWLKANTQTGLKKYLLVFVPEGQNWSAAKTLSSQQFAMKNGVAEIPQEIAALIRESLQKEAVELNAVSQQQGKVVSFALSKKDEAKQIGFYEVKLNQTP